jgi:DNA-binding transcriptional LysR family regulator
VIKISDIRAVPVHNCTMNQPDWDDLRYFLALHDAGSLSGAARAAGVEHTTVARRIDALEAALAVRLFDRFPRGWSLTAAGRELVPHARKMEDGLHGLMRTASGGVALSGTVCVSAPPALCAYMLAPRLKPALERLSGIEVDVRGEARRADLMRRESDIALRFQRPTAPGLAVKLLATVGYRLYASAAYLKKHKPEQWQFLGYDEVLQEAPQHQWLDKIRGQRRYCLRSNDLGVLFQAAVAGCGVAVLPPLFFDIARSGLVAIEAPACPVKRKLWLVMHEDVRRSPPVRAVADEIIALFTSLEPA